MNGEVRNTYRCFRRVEEFLAAHNFEDGPATLGKQAAQLREVVEQLSRQSLDQEAGFRLTKAQTKHQRELRQRLWEQHMQPIARVAREVFGIAGMDRALKLPHMSCPNERIVSAAGAMAEAAERQQSAFLEHGLPADFVASLRSAAAELATVMGTRDGNQRRRVEATAEMNELLKRGRRALRLLNAIVRPRLAHDPSLLAAWDTVRTVRAFGGANQAPAEGTAPEVVAA